MRASTAVLAAGAISLCLAACGEDEEPLEGWGPGAAPAVVVTAAPAPTPPAPAPPAPEPPAPEPAPDGGGGDESAAPPPPTTEPAPVYAPNGQTVRVRSLDNSFRGETTEVVVGTEILWTNDGRNEHDVLPVDDSETWGALRDVFQPGDEYRHVFLEPGVYDYYCSIHGTKEVGMVGTIVVTAPS